MAKTSLATRMKKNELYVVITSANRETLEQSWLVYADGTPRLYAKHAVDNRILDDTPICTTWKSMLGRLWNGKGPVMVPLSMMTYSAATIRLWASSQREVDPQLVIDYVTRVYPPESPDSESVRFEMHNVAFTNRFWVEEHPQGTLSDLLQFLQSVQSECERFDDDDVIAEYEDELSTEAHDYFSSWDDFSEPDEDDDPATFGYRRDNLDEDIESVHTLYAALGGDVIVATLSELNAAG